MNKTFLLVICFVFTGLAGAEEIAPNRPAMPDLFFTQEQRKQLEILRGGEFGELDIQPEFIPILFPQKINELEPAPESAAGAALKNEPGLMFNAYIVNNATGDKTFWLNNQMLTHKEVSGLREFKSVTLDNARLYLRRYDAEGAYILSVGQEITGNSVTEGLSAALAPNFPPLKLIYPSAYVKFH